MCGQDTFELYLTKPKQDKENYIIKNNIEYIISSGPPHSMHLIALGLKNKFTSLKWVADLETLGQT